jgi:hypothetical protein
LISVDGPLVLRHPERPAICALDILMRLSDVVNLRRAQDRKTYLLVEDPKVQLYRVPVSARLRKALDSVPNTGRYDFGHRRRAENPRDFRGSVKQMFEAGCKAAHIPYGRKHKGGRLRHSTGCATRPPRAL